MASKVASKAVAAPKAPRTPKTPKTPKDPNAESSQHIVVLCNLMMCSETFEASTTKLAPILGLSHAKNVPRKINGIINPHGFEFKNNKVYKKDEEGAPATSANTSGDDTETPTKKKTATKSATKPTPKKRKVDEATEDEAMMDEDVNGEEIKGEDIKDDDIKGDEDLNDAGEV
ncbi:hypothetical protein PFICI_00704 [Pestalotiopsis fici W106-1]|uniref:Uncharacterized protein n=1 Tax=Pestalotiopsis fici (strain W106-1 / CGMCC3.15140) TaxID=1229662 RepID=W3XNN8_PESFW|nr:uncharacterized protein PFICI_00704 [Pestalotiopsis fici W106-1]ETS86876.1 hypothetical protein PFICI_00704 [Pestalotiopsis fici W106-1]